MSDMHDSIDGAIQILNSELAKVAKWIDSNKLTPNVSKTQMLMMSIEIKTYAACHLM